LEASADDMPVAEQLIHADGRASLVRRWLYSTR
jgi:hypothetical protein